VLSFCACGLEALPLTDACDALAAESLVVTEVHANPEGRDGDREYIEVFNAGDLPISLQGITLTASRADGADPKSHRILEGELPGGGYFVLGNASSNPMPDYIDYSYANALGNLRNTEGSVSLWCGERLIDRICVYLGGRVAEELVYGPEKVTTGAGNDIERATSMARRMVTSFGMSDVIGLVAVADNEQEVFLGREISQRRTVSEHTQRIVDQEVKRILDEAHERAHAVLGEHQDLLESIAQALLDRETLDRTEIELLERGEPLPPVKEPDGPAPTLETPKATPAKDAAPRPFGLGGEGPLPGPAPGVTEGLDEDALP